MGFLSTASSNAGDLQDMVRRLRSTLPLGWFPVTANGEASNSPILDGVLAGVACAWTFCFGLLKATSQQTRLASASGGFLDLISQDFFGAELPRKPGEPDAAFRSRIAVGFGVQRGTRQDVAEAVRAVVGTAPLLCEPRRGLDCGGIAGADALGAGGGLGYGCAALRYGSRALEFQYLVTVASIASFAPGAVCVRPTGATFIDGLGAMRLVGANILRPNYSAGVPVSALIEGRGCNLIKDSLYWGGFSSSEVPIASPVSLLASRPVLSISVQAGIGPLSPSVKVAAAGTMVTCSVWVMIEHLGGLSALTLFAQDLGPGGSASTASAHLASVGVWQRVVTSLQLLPGVGLNLQMSLGFASSGEDFANVLTQCWQVEAGDTATSYIPTAGMIGFREADTLLPVSGTPTPGSLQADAVFEAIASCIPVATTAWSSVALPVQP